MSYDPGSGERPQPHGGGNWPPQGGQPPPPPGGGYGQPAPGWGPPSQGGGPGEQRQERGAFASLFDYSFSSFATPGLIKLLYIVGSVLIVLVWLTYVVIGFTLPGAGATLGVLALVGGGIAALFMLAMLRVSLEFYYSVVRMSEDIHHRR
jgi:hypothetical protein